MAKGKGGMKQLVLDDLDFALLELLSLNGKQSLHELSKKLEVPRSTIHASISKLERKGVIKTYAALIDHRMLGLDLLAFVMISFDKRETKLDQEAVAKKIGKLNQVQEVFIIAGEFDILVKVRASSIDDLGDLVVKDLKEISGVGNTLTHIVLKTIKESPNCIHSSK